MATAYVALGSNLGDRAGHLRRALEALRATPDVTRVEPSRVYETAPVGPAPQGPFLNAVARVETTLPPRALLDRLLAVERAEGRVRTGERWGPRTLDLDLLVYGEAVVSQPGLELPHPRLHERPFVLEPLAEIEPDLVHPTRGETVRALAARVREPGALRVWKGDETREPGTGRAAPKDDASREDPS